MAMKHETLRPLAPHRARAALGTFLLTTTVTMFGAVGTAWANNTCSTSERDAGIAQWNQYNAWTNNPMTSGWINSCVTDGDITAMTIGWDQQVVVICMREDTGCYMQVQKDGSGTHVAASAGDGSFYQDYAQDIVLVHFVGTSQVDYVHANVDVKVRAVTGPGNDEIYTGSGDDEIHSSVGDDLIVSEGGDDYIHGYDGNDFIYSGSGDDDIYGGRGEDIIFSGDGDDYIECGDGNDVVNAGTGNDTVFGGSGRDFLDGNAGDDYMEGQDDRDFVYGYTGYDSLYGNDGKDVVFGHDHYDHVSGGAADDKCSGEEKSGCQGGVNGSNVVDKADDMYGVCWAKVNWAMDRHSHYVGIGVDYHLYGVDYTVDAAADGMQIAINETSDAFTEIGDDVSAVYNAVANRFSSWGFW